MFIAIYVLFIRYAFLPLSHGLMGSPSENIPDCLNGGKLTVTNGRHGCSCPMKSMDRRCRLTQITLKSSMLQTKLDPVDISLTPNQSFHMGFEYITNEPTGNGVIMSISNPAGTDRIVASLVKGRVSMSINVGGIKEKLEFGGTTPVTNDNAWHYVNLFFEVNANNHVVLYLLLDHCRYSPKSDCAITVVTNSSKLSFQLVGNLELGAHSTGTVKSFDGCFDRLFINREVKDFYTDTTLLPSIRGCQVGERGCYHNGKPVCGTFGSCRNALSETDMLTCVCRPGYRPNISLTAAPHRWPCEMNSTPWSLSTSEYRGRFLQEVPSRFKISMRTRTKTFKVFVVASWGLYLTVKQGKPELVLNGSSIELGKLNVSDGNWHLYEVTITAGFMSLQIDQLDQDYYGVSRVKHFTLSQGPTDVIIAQGAPQACIDDAWVDFQDTWRNAQYDYPLEQVTNPSYVRHVDWALSGRINSCSAGKSACKSSTPPDCGPNATCVDEWRGYRCQCGDGMVKDADGVCQLEQCYPNPCAHGNCSARAQGSLMNVNFTCSCPPGWTGPLCSIKDETTEAMLKWWWILLIIILIVLILTAILVILIIRCCKTKKSSKNAESAVMKYNERVDADKHPEHLEEMNEEDFRGEIDYEILENAGKASQGSKIPTDTHRPPREPFKQIDEHGQRTSMVPPWDALRDDPESVVNMDEALEYMYEGLDGAPPPEFRPFEPSSTSDDKIAAENLKSNGHVPRQTTADNSEISDTLAD